MATNKIFVLLLVSLVVLADPIDPDYNYDQFMRQYGRNYTGEERKVHEDVFNANLKILREKISQGIDLKINNFTDWLPQKLKGFLGYRSRGPTGKFTQRHASAPQLAVRPTTFNWNAQGAVTSVKNQLSCGSCWAFSATAVYQSTLAIVTNGTHYDLAEQYALECETSQSSGCNGGWPAPALKLMNQNGIPLQSQYPYQQYNDHFYGNKICTETDRIKLEQPGTVTSFYSLSVAEIEQDLIDYGPMSVSIRGGDFYFQFAGSSGLIDNCDSYQWDLTHVVLLYGYNQTHWFIKNSWGTYWGDNGHAYVSKTKDCGIHYQVDELRTGFAPQPPGPEPEPDPTMARLYIKMMDIYGDGWNSYVLAFKQNSTIVATFGQAFTSGPSSTKYVTIKKDQQTSIVVKSKGSYSSEIGFTVLLPNNESLYKWTAGSTFGTNQIFKIFCLASSCQKQPAESYTFTLFDKFGDGWGGSTLAFEQNGNVYPIQGQSGLFKTKTVTFNFSKYYEARLKVMQVGDWSEEIGYSMTNSKGEIAFSRAPGKQLTTDEILGAFCELCENYKTGFSVSLQQSMKKFAAATSPAEVTVNSTNKITFHIVMTDTYGDGWNGNVFGFKQGSTIAGKFGDGFDSGAEKIVYVTINGMVESQIVMIGKGSYTSQIGFRVLCPNGTLAYEKLPGNILLSTTVFKNLCPLPGCLVVPSVTYTLSLLDSQGNGWVESSNSYIILGFAQNETTYVTGDSQIATQFSSKDMQFTFKRFSQVTLRLNSYYHTYGDQVGYILRDSEGTIILSRRPGNLSIVEGYGPLGTFCPDCQNYENETAIASRVINLIITMSDSKGDGWNGNVFGIKQDSEPTVKFGVGFSSGKTFGPVQVSIKQAKQAKVVLVSKGTGTSEIGFKISHQNGTVIYERSPGSSFSPYQIFKTFSPSTLIRESRTITYTMTLLDSWGDGWNNNRLHFSQNGTIIPIEGQEGEFKEKNITVKFNRTNKNAVSLVVSQIGDWSDEVGFTLMDSDGVAVLERVPGQEELVLGGLGSFCPACMYDEEAVAMPPLQASSNAQKVDSALGATTSQCSPVANNTTTAYQVATYVLAGVVGLLIIALAIITYKVCSIRKSANIKKNSKLTQPINSSTDITLKQNNI